MSDYKPTAKEIKELREKTLAGFQDCQKALAEAGGDPEAAEDIIRKKGLQVAVKKAHRETAEGLIVAKISDDKSCGSMVEVNCESDFVCKTEQFQNLTIVLAHHALAKAPEDICDGTTLYDHELHPSGGKTVKTAIDEVIGKIGENMGLKQAVRFKAAEPGVVHAYIHPPGKVGVLVEVGFDKPEDKDKADQLAHELTLQIAFANPDYIIPADVPEKVLAREREIAESKARDQGKPEHMIPKIAEGMLRKYYADACLLEQPFAKDPKMPVKDLIAKSGISGATVRRFARFSLK